MREPTKVTRNVHPAEGWWTFRACSARSSKTLRYPSSAVAALAVLVTACGVLPRLAAVPASLTEQATVPGFPDSRLWLDGDLAPFVKVATSDLARERRTLEQQGLPVEPMPPINFLAISGGGDKGAFAAGVLAGWTASGQRPTFRVVTGVSAGALIAPFAYLGPEYDDLVRRVATSIGPGDVFKPRGRLAGLLSDGMSSSSPLRRLVEKYVTPELLAKIANEYATGRALQVATTDLDAGRQVVWNMGAIASSSTPGALELFRNIMIASISIPGAVSPVMIDVEVNGKHYQEMHVDGGVIAQLFAYPSRAVAALEKATGKPLNRSIRVYVIRNGRLDPEWTDTPRRTLAIGRRAIDSLVQAEGMEDVRRTYRIASQDKADLNLAYIAADFPDAEHQMFETSYMNALFDYGYRLARAGAAWHQAPPGELETPR
jgi:predicted acylesterase/phospholipase RssA